MKKIISLIIIVLLVCGCNENNARSSVKRYLNKYKSLDSEVLVDMESIIQKENLDNSLQEKYRDILKKQYKDLDYEILEEEYDDEVSYITVRVSVYDLYKAQRDAAVYLENNPNDFSDESGNYLESKYINYKLDRMKNMNDRIEYTLVFTVTKEDNKYSVVQPTENDLKKIHGIYNYELN